jgi:hypothetical protein
MDDMFDVEFDTVFEEYTVVPNSNPLLVTVIRSVLAVQKPIVFEPEPYNPVVVSFPKIILGVPGAPVCDCIIVSNLVVPESIIYNL